MTAYNPNAARMARYLKRWRSKLHQVTAANAANWVKKGIISAGQAQTALKGGEVYVKFYGTPSQPILKGGLQPTVFSRTQQEIKLSERQRTLTGPLGLLSQQQQAQNPLQQISYDQAKAIQETQQGGISFLNDLLEKIRALFTR